MPPRPSRSAANFAKTRAFPTARFPLGVNTTEPTLSIDQATTVACIRFIALLGPRIEGRACDFGDLCATASQLMGEDPKTAAALVAGLIWRDMRRTAEDAAAGSPPPSVN